jgi:hypothetical protein
MDTNAFYKLTVCSRLGEKTRGFLFDLQQARREIDRNSIKDKLICRGGRQVIRAPVICRTRRSTENSTIHGVFFLKLQLFILEIKKNNNKERVQHLVDI